MNNSSETLWWITKGPLCKWCLWLPELFSHSHFMVTRCEAVQTVRRLYVCALTGLEWRVFKSSCLPKKFQDEWSFGGLTYHVSGDPDGTMIALSIICLEYNESKCTVCWEEHFEASFKCSLWFSLHLSQTKKFSRLQTSWVDEVMWQIWIQKHDKLLWQQPNSRSNVYKSH